MYDKVMKGDWGGIEPGKSLSDGFRDADPEAILSWERRMRELVVMEEMRRHYRAGKTLSGPEGEQETEKAFAVLSEAILRETLEGSAQMRRKCRFRSASTLAAAGRTRLLTVMRTAERS